MTESEKMAHNISDLCMQMAISQNNDTSYRELPRDLFKMEKESK